VTLVDQGSATILAIPDQKPVHLPYTNHQHDRCRATLRRSSTSVRTSIRFRSRSLIITHPKVVRLPGSTPERAIGHFYRPGV